MGFLKVVQYVFLGVFPIFEISCYAIMRSGRSDIAIRKRNTAMIYISTIAAWFAYANLVFGLFGGYCGIFHTFVILIQPLSVGPQLLRGITLWGMLERNKLMLKYGETAQLRRTHLRPDNNLQVIEECQSSSRDEEPSSKVGEEGAQGGPDCAKEKAIVVRKKMRTLVKVSKVILIGFPAILITTMLFFTDRTSLLKTDHDQCFPEPNFILNIGRAFSVGFTVAAIMAMLLVRHCNDELGIRREITRNIAIVFMTNVVIFVTSYHKKYDLLLILYIIQQIFLSFSMIIMPCWESSGFSNPMLEYIKNRGKSALPGYGRPLPNVQGGRPSLMMGMKAKESVVDKKRQRERTTSLDAGLCILLSSSEGIDTFTEHCSREFR
jgi:hypothetical protein